MAWSECEALLRELGWTQGTLASHLGLNRNTVTQWKQNSEVPKYAIAYLELALVVHKAYLAMSRV